MKSNYFRLVKIYSFILLILPSCFLHTLESPLTVGMELSNPPFEMIDVNGSPTGISVDIAKQFAKYSKRELRILNIPFIGLIPSLKSKKIDCIISSMTPTKEREKSIAFSKPYISIALCLLINKNTKADTASELNQKSYKIIVRTGTTGQQYAQSLFPNAEILALEHESSCVTEVIQGKADAFLYDQLAVYANWQKYPDKLKANLTPLAQDFWAVGIRQSDKELKENVDTFLNEFFQSGGFEKLTEQYLKKEQQAFEKLNVPLIFSPELKGP